ncbi:ABC transporter permease subunit [Sutcliffiella cohnii]|uniref:ABC transporter permease n=1 Tax=Sutcliffiella cohnii TaxID=33932 RepID=UPI002E1E0B72|nr:ABC transporter permease subunit [Sutcliffiella cohnii]MED4015106.1 ABC transporter permease [Sutcliffiella cohnii]
MKAQMINPMLNKEFKLRFRTIKSFLAILLYLIVLGAIALFFIYMTTRYSSMGMFRPEQSKSMFMVMAFVQLALIFFMTPGLTAGVISSEREKQTLNILLTTQQTSTSIILSKLGSSLSFLLLIVLSSLPLYSIVFLFGGISPSLLFITFGTYLLTMLTLGSIGVFFSTIIKKTIVAMICTYGVAFFLAAGTAVLTFFTIAYTQQGMTTPSTNPAPYFIAMFNPFIYLMLNFEQHFKIEFETITGITMSLGIGMLISYLLLSALLIFISIKKLRPNMRPTKRKG